MIDFEKLQRLREGWQPPRELERGCPRPTRYTWQGRFLILLAVALAAGGVALSVLIHKNAREEQERYRQSSGRAQAVITNLQRVRSGKNERCYATYQFQAGARYSRSATVGCGTWRTLRVGDRREVRYIESNPAVSRLEGAERSPAPAWLALLPLVLMPLMARLLWWDLARQRRLLEDGRAAPAIVTRLGMRSDKGRRVYYEFLTLGGARATGRFGPVRGKGQPEVGSVLTVVYYPDNAKLNRRYPLATVVVAE